MLSPKIDGPIEAALFAFVLGYASIALILGAVAAFTGRKADSKRKEFVESLVLTFWAGITPLVFKAPWIVPFSAGAGFALASYASGRYKRFVYPILGGLLAVMFVTTFLALAPVIEIFSATGLVLLLAFAFVGYAAGEKYRDWIKIISTAYAGASMLASGVLATMFLMQSKPGLFLKNALLASLIPIIGGLLEEITCTETIVYAGTFVTTLSLGFLNQRRQYLSALVAAEK